MTADLAGQVRAICLSLPEVVERLSHGARHHDDDFPHLWCAGLPGAQQELVAAVPGRFFRQIGRAHV